VPDEGETVATTPAPPATGPGWLTAVRAALAGFGGGLLIHRFGVLPLLAQSYAATSLATFGPGLVAAAIALRRAAPGRLTTPPLLALAVVAAGLGVGLGFLVAPPLGRLPLERRALPGFELALPAGIVDDANASGYAAGKVLVEQAGGLPAKVHVTWGVGVELNDTIVRAVLAGLAAGPSPATDVHLDVPVAAPAGTESRSFRATKSDVEIWTSLVLCGSRTLTIMTGSSDSGVARLHARVVGSLACHSDPTQEATNDVPVVLNLGPEWRRFPEGGSQLRLTNGAEIVMAQTMFAAEPEKAVDAMIAPVLAAGMKIGKKENDRWPVEMVAEDVTARGFMLVKRCPERRLSLILWWLPMKPSARGGATAIEGARCQGKDEAPQVWPELPAP
jgi:hypothetical protein